MEFIERALISYLYYKQKATLQEITSEFGLTFVKGIKLLNKLNDDVYNFDIILSENRVSVNSLTKDHYIILGDVDLNNVTQRCSVLLLKLLTSFNYVEIDDLASELMVSRSTINNDLRRIRQNISRFKVGIEGVPNKGLRISGKEHNIQLLYGNFVTQNIDTVFPVNPSIIEALNKVMHKDFADVKTKYDVLKVIEFFVYRKTHSRNINNEFIVFKNFKGSDVLPIVSSIERETGKKLGHDEIDFIFFPLLVKNSSQLQIQFSTIDEHIIKEIISEATLKIKVNFGIEFDKEHLYNRIKYHIGYLINRLQFKVTTKDQFSIEFSKQYPLAKQISELFLKQIENVIGEEGSLEDLNYLTIYFVLFLSEKEKFDGEIKIVVPKIGIMVSHGVSIYQLIKHSIMANFPHKVEINYLTKYDDLNSTLEDYHLIITNENVEQKNDKIYYIKDIEHFIENIKVESSKIISLLQKIINYENVIVDFRKMKLASDLSFSEKLKNILFYLYKDVEMAKNVYRLIRQREYQSEFKLNNYISFPHITNLYDNQIRLLISKTDENEIIIFLSVPTDITISQEFVLTKIYDKVFSFVQDDKPLNFSEVDTFQKFMNM